MEQVYDEYFQRRLGALREGEAPRLAGAPEVREIAETAVSVARDVAPLRSDAEVLLYVLAVEFVGAPLQSTQTRTDEAREMVYADTRMIAESAREFTDEQALTAHSVITALDRTWGQLQTTSLAIWG
jgi:hypothetical protein